jgi:septal ring factor EnvC (AmiA/AmiB activator)
MGKKKLLGLSALLLFVQTAAAQSTGGIIPMILEIFGLPVGNIYTAIGTAAIIGEMILLLYIPFKIGARKLNLEKDILGQGSRGGRNLALILSTLMVLSLLGVSAQYGGYSMGQAIEAYGALSLVAVFGVLIVALSVMLYALGQSGGVFSMVKGGGMSLKASGKDRQASALKKQAVAEKKENKYRDKLQELRGEEEQMDEDIDDDILEDDEEAVKIEEDLVSKIKDLLEHMSHDLDNDVEEVDDALEELKEALKYTEEEGPDIGYASARINRAHAYLSHLNNEIIQNARSDIGSSSADYSDYHYHQLITQDETITSPSRPLIFDGPWGGARTDIRSQVDPYPTGGGEIKYPSDHSSADASKIGGIDFNFRDDVLSNLTTISGSKPDYGICEAREDIAKAEDSVKAVIKDTEAEDELEGDAFQELFDALDGDGGLLTIHSMIGEVKKMLNDLEKENEKLEKTAQERSWKELFEEVESDEDAVEDLEDYIDHMENLESQIEPKLEDVYKVLKDLIEFDSQELDQLQKDKNLLTEIIQHSTNGGSGVPGALKDFFETAASNLGAGGAGVTQHQAESLAQLEDICDQITNDAGEINKASDKIQDTDKRDNGRGKEILEELSSVVS